ncbi:enoyl-CoA hydratase-related protein [Pararoseomonas indoligenes]|uniref:Enoyl-CoA hydratase/isomerase family protein n=1 Tax=Roseomonas indoligenes TaxID=2820811 RepID=A0A940MX65_9PROT|nr:enoyl-CoA hydratase-related protein [Pararoseomonas indoligenes]MBP0495888.1 enoyl-CoA hydratase/isomerase family protein [Pararoseomonas indoligenes]
MEGADTIDLSREGPIAVITLNRPQVRNAIDLAAAHRLAAAVDAVEADPAIRVAIITGAGEVAFSAGADLRARARGEGRAVIAPHGFAGFVRRPRRKPFIAVVNGFAVGGGLEIALACELVVAAPHASFSLPEPMRGLIAGGDCLPSVFRRLPPALAWEVALAGRRLTAEEALTAGMVNRVAPDALGAAREMARAVIVGAPRAIEGTIALARRLMAAAPPDYDALAERTQAALMATADAAEAARAFAEKRAPVWTDA